MTPLPPVGYGLVRTNVAVQAVAAELLTVIDNAVLLDVGVRRDRRIGATSGRG